jgi:hypothetical protein
LHDLKEFKKKLSKSFPVFKRRRYIPHVLLGQGFFLAKISLALR